MSQSKPIPEQRQQAIKAMQSGNIRDAYDTFRQLCLDPSEGAALVYQLGDGRRFLAHMIEFEHERVCQTAVGTASRRAKAKYVLQTLAEASDTPSLGEIARSDTPSARSCRASRCSWTFGAA
jgi:hypothetical protein